MLSKEVRRGIAGIAILASLAGGIPAVATGCGEKTPKASQEDILSINKQIETILDAKGLDGKHKVYSADPVSTVSGGGFVFLLGGIEVETEATLSICWEADQYDKTTTTEMGQRNPISAVFVANDVSEIKVDPNLKPGECFVNFDYSNRIFEGYGEKAKKAIEEAQTFNGLLYVMYRYGSSYVELTVAPEDKTKFAILGK